MKFDEVWERFRNYPTVHLATVANGHPRVRPMTLIVYDEKIWMVTHTEKNKVAEIQKNSHMEFSQVFIENKMIGCLRATGRVKIIVDEDIKKDISNVITFFSGYWRTADDPNYTLLSLELDQVYYSPPTEDGIKFLFDLTKGKDTYSELPPYRLIDE